MKWTHVLFDAFGHVFSYFKANFGSPDFDLYKDRLSSRIMICTVIFLGNFMWICYNGALTSVLIVPGVKKPFHDFESLAESGYMCV